MFDKTTLAVLQSAHGWNGGMSSRDVRLRGPAIVPVERSKRQNGGAMSEQRYRVDCGTVPSESGCTLVIEGPEDDVLDAAVEHARSKHGHTEPQEVLRAAIKGALEPV